MSSVALLAWPVEGKSVSLITRETLYILDFFLNYKNFLVMIYKIGKLRAENSCFFNLVIENTMLRRDLQVVFCFMIYNGLAY